MPKEQIERQDPSFTCRYWMRKVQETTKEHWLASATPALSPQGGDPVDPGGRLFPSHYKAV